MAMLPELSKLRVAPLAGEKVWPILQTENVFILPGVPEFFQSKMAVIADHFLDSRPMVGEGLCFLSSQEKIEVFVATLALQRPLRGCCAIFGVNGSHCSLVVRFAGLSCKRSALGVNLIFGCLRAYLSLCHRQCTLKLKG